MKTVILELSLMAVWIVPCLVILGLLRRFAGIPDFVFRKLVHTLYFASAAFLLTFTHGTGFALADCLVILAFWTPILLWAEHRPWYQRFFVEKRQGEILRTFWMLYGLLAVMILCCLLTDRPLWIPADAVLLWGVGDMAAAIIGRLFGRKKYIFGPNKGVKSYVGSLAMLAATALTTGLLCIPDPARALPLFLGALCATAVEALTPGEWDTLTVTLAAFVPLFLMGR